MPASSTSGAVFLSYAREDSDATRRIADALRQAGVEVWFDQNELRGGDAWDAQIRRQIRECAIFIPVISAHTQARHEGYFRREWRLAVDRTHDMLHGIAFIMPIVVDGISEDAAAVPEEFLRYQWTRLPGAVPTPEFVQHITAVLSAPHRGATLHPIPLRRHAPDVPPRRSGMRRPAGIVAAAVLLVVLAWLGLKTWGPAGPAAGGAVPAAARGDRGPQAGKSIAVLAFTNLSGEKENEHFSDGVSEELLNILAKVPGLKVSARTSAFFFKGKEVPVQEIAAKLNVGYVVEGSVQKSGSRVRIAAKLVNAADGFQLWSETFTHELKDIFALQDEIAGNIAQNLKLQLSAQSRAGGVVNPEAHALVLEARHLWYQRKLDSFNRAEVILQNAIQLDRNFALAHATLANVYAMRAAYHMLDGRTEQETAADTDRAQAAALRAIALEPAQADAYPALAYALMIEGQVAESEKYFQKALELNPNHAVAHSWYANLRASQGRLDEALVEYQRSAEIDPLWKVNLGTYAAILSFARRPQAALDLTDRVLASQAELFLPSTATRGTALLALGRKAEAIAEANRILENPQAMPRWYADSTAIWILQQAGAHAEARAGAESLLQRLPAQSYQRGCVLVAVGRFEEALPSLERTPPRAKHRMFWEPMWDPWRENPKFLALIEKLNCVQEYRTARTSLERVLRQPEAKK